MIIPAAYKLSLSTSAFKITPAQPRWSFVGINIHRSKSKHKQRRAMRLSA